MLPENQNQDGGENPLRCATNDGATPDFGFIWWQTIKNPAKAFGSKARLAKLIRLLASPSSIALRNG